MESPPRSPSGRVKDGGGEVLCHLHAQLLNQVRVGRRRAAEDLGNGNTLRTKIYTLQKVELQELTKKELL